MCTDVYTVKYVVFFTKLLLGKLKFVSNFLVCTGIGKDTRYEHF